MSFGSDLKKLVDENERLKQNLRESNDGFEEYERKYYLTLQELEIYQEAMKEIVALIPPVMPRPPHVLYQLKGITKRFVQQVEIEV